MIKHFTWGITFLILQGFSVGYSQKNSEDLAENKPKLPPKVEVSQVKKMVYVDVKTSIISGFSSGNAKMLSVHFASNVAMNLQSKKGLYSKSQAMQVLQSFFNEHTPTSFNITYNGSSVKSKTFYIGDLITKNGQFKVTVGTKEENGVKYISQISVN